MILDHERKKEDQPTIVTKGNGDSDTIFARVQNESTFTVTKILKIRRHTNTRINTSSVTHFLSSSQVKAALRKHYFCAVCCYSLGDALA